MSHRVFIGLGSNLQNPSQQVLRAFEALKTLPKTQLVGVSSLRLSKPQGPQDQPDFVNAVAQLATDLSPQTLLSELQRLEQQQGKVKVRHWGERVIDLDVLLFDDLVLSEPNLVIPHPEMLHRDFVLEPLLEILPKDDSLLMERFQNALTDLQTAYLRPES